MGFNATQLAADLKTLFTSDNSRDVAAQGIADAVTDNYTDPTTDNILLQAHSTTAQSIATASTTEVLKYNNVQQDPGSNYSATTGKFAAPGNGIYSISWAALSSSVAWAVGNTWQARLLINGLLTLGNVFLGSRWAAQAAHTGHAGSQGSVNIVLNEDDTAEIRIFHNQGSAVNTITDTAGLYVWLTIALVREL